MATDYAVYRTGRLLSTQDEARARFTGDPFLVIADQQTAGRGRTGAEWMTAPAAVAASLAFDLDWPPAQLPRVTLVAGLAALDALGSTLSLKWPNDLVDDGELKVGGLLVETDGACVVAGLGVNLWWPDAPAGVGALHPRRPGPDEPDRLARRWADSLLVRLSRGAANWGRDEYSSHCRTLGHEITWSGGAGVAVEIDDNGALVVETDGVRRTLSSGVVSQVRRATLPPCETKRDEE